MALRPGIRLRVATGSAVALALGAVAVSVALVAAAGTQAASHGLLQQLVPAATTSENLLNSYEAQQMTVRAYVTSGHSSVRAQLNAEATRIGNEQDQLARLTRGYGPITDQLDATVVAEQAWLSNVAGPELLAMSWGDAAAARVQQADTAYSLPYVLAVHSAAVALQAQITAAQQVLTSKLSQAQGTLLAALIVVCVLLAAISVDRLLAAWVGLLKPLRALRRAAEAVAAGDYDTRMPTTGPSELADLGDGIELMRVRLVTALAEQQIADQRFRRLFEVAPDAMIALGPDGSITMANAQAEQLFGYAAGDLIGLPTEVLVPEEGRAGLAEARGALAGGRVGYFTDPHARRQVTEFTLVRKDGRGFPAEITLSSLPTDSGTLVMAAIRDVTERVAMEAERERLRAAAEQERTERREQQSQRLESLGQLVGGVAHDFNNLLNVIQGYADFTAETVQSLAESDARLAPVVEDIEQVRAAARQASRLTRQLLTFSRHDATSPEVLDLNEAVTEAGQLLRRTLGEHIDLVITAEPALSRVKADRGQLEQVLVNLAVNARDAMPGGGRLTIDTGNIEVDETYATGRPGLTPGRYAGLRVSDTGMGMDRATADRVFEPFFSTKPKGHGTGLGLATVYGIVTQAGGTIEVYSEKGLGTTISVLLPATDEDVAPDLAPDADGDDLRGHGETILVVEDEESLRELTSRILTRNGYQVCVVSGGAEAVRRAGDPAQAIDLVLTDVVMPEMLGNEVAARIAAIRPGVPALFMSGYAQPILDTHGVPAPHYDILGKPFTEEALLSRVRNALSRIPAPRRADADSDSDSGTTEGRRASNESAL
jgi:PAS domain S-box-containing protein